MINLGQMVVCNIQKFTGVTTAKRTNIDGSVQLRIEPTNLSSKGNRLKSEWFDECILESVFNEFNESNESNEFNESNLDVEIEEQEETEQGFYSFGCEAVDELSGFVGIIVSKIEYINGLIKYKLEPTSLTRLGKRKGEWFDEFRISLNIEV